MKVRSLLWMALILISGAIFSGFYLTQFGQDEFKTVLTVEAEDAKKAVNFDIAITKGEGEKSNFQILENQHTPLKMELEDGDYLIVVHKKSNKGKITTQVEKFTGEKSSALANAEGEVMVLTTKKGIRLSAFEMK